MLNFHCTPRSLFLILGMALAAVPYAQKGSLHHQAEDRGERLAQELSLTPAQASAWKALDEEFRAKRKELKAIPDTVARKEAMRSLAREMRTAREAILTPEQKEKATALRAERQRSVDASGGYGERRTAWMTTELGLTEEQQAQIRDIEARYEGKRQAAMRLTDEGARRTALKEIRRARQAAITGTLTPEQQERLLVLKEERKEANGLRKDR